MFATTPDRHSRAPVRLHVVAGARGQRLHRPTFAVGDRDLPRPPAVAGEGQVAAVRGPGRVLAAAATLGDLPDLPRGQVHHRHLEPALETRGIGDLAVLLRWVPGGGVVPVADRGQPPDV